jgi:MFS family permease
MQEIPNPENLIEVGETGAPVPHDPYAALRHRDFLLYLTGGLFSAIGGNMQAVAIGWEIYERTGSAMALGWVGLVQAAPIILLALPFGQLADRFDRRRLVIIGMLLSVASSAALAYLSFTNGPVGAFFGVLFVGAIGRALNWPAMSALMPTLVPREVFGNAVTWNSARFQVASVAGPALGGLLIAVTHSAGIAYATTAGLTLLFLVMLVFIPSRPVNRSPEPLSIQSLLAGLGFVWRTKVVLAAITLDLFAVLLGGATALLPIYAKDILHVGPTGLGWLRAAPAIGAMLMAVTMAHRPPLRQAGRALVWAVIGFGLVTIGFGLSKWFWFSLVMLGASGALDNISVVVRHSLVQLRTPDEMRGRVSAVNTVFISCSNELGEFESGFVAAAFGAVVSAVSGGIGTILVVLAVTRIWPEIRQLRTLSGDSARR